jgi:hypothetical protein
MTVITRLLAAFVLILAGGVCWNAASIADDLAVRHERRATLEDELRLDSSAWRDLIARAITAGFAGDAGIEAQGDYWKRRYDTLTGSDDDARAGVEDGGPARLLIGAHALFRKMEREGARTSGPERLDQVLQAYAGVLKNGGFNQDAAYNYEFVSRLRDAVARSKTAAAARSSSPSPSAGTPDDLPRGPTIHGRPGAHPPGSRGDEFEVLTPMDYGEREAQPEPTPGRPLPRKG